MNNLFLTIPHIKYKAQYITMIKEWNSSKEPLVPCVLKLDYSNFSETIKRLNNLSFKCSTFWLVDENGKMFGVSNVRYELNTNSGGHISYGVRPLERCKGYGTQLLKLSIEQLKSRGISNAIVTCSNENIASEKVILKNGGIFKEFFYESGKLNKKFQIQC